MTEKYMIKKKPYWIPDKEKKRLYFNVKDKKAYNFGFQDFIDEEEDERITTNED